MRWCLRVLSGSLAMVWLMLLWVPAGLSQNSLPVVIVEEASEGAPVAAFEYLPIGWNFELRQDATIVLGYLTSCRREVITGGRVTIGNEQSVVDGGQIAYETVPCDGGQIDLTQEAVAASGVIVFRGPDDPDVTLYSATPVFTFAPETELSILEIERVDRTEEVRRYPIEKARVDLLELDSPLNSGGLYEVRYGEEARSFRIVVYARPGGPLVGRLVRL
jgi:hypothetical protein